MAVYMIACYLYSIENVNSENVARRVVNIYSKISCKCVIRISFSQNVDVNECIAGSNNCHPNATCYNTVSSYICICDAGFTGDGENCTRGEVTVFHIHTLLNSFSHSYLKRITLERAMFTPNL